jgi:hypothetical protein
MYCGVKNSTSYFLFKGSACDTFLKNDVKFFMNMTKENNQHFLIIGECLPDSLGLPDWGGACRKSSTANFFRYI